MMRLLLLLISISLLVGCGSSDKVEDVNAGKGEVREVQPRDRAEPGGR